MLEDAPLVTVDSTTNAARRRTWEPLHDIPHPSYMLGQHLELQVEHADNTEVLFCSQILYCSQRLASSCIGHCISER